MPRINVLPKDIADLIAAGEVVERPSSIIKEFVENSIDAGSTKIIVEIKNGGKTYLRVTDNGCGIHRDDVKKAFISHATSKINDISDLDAISTLGFRGEALASVCAVSKVELLTCTADNKIGTQYVIEGGNEVLIDDVGAPVGTTIVVKDIFYNIPARLKFLKKDVQEGNYIASLLEKIAVSHPEISFKFIRDGKLQFSTPGDNTLKSAIYAVFGKDFTSSLLSTEGSMNGVNVKGYVSKPTAGRGNRAMQTFFVNGRYVKSVVFFTALEQAYKNSIMVGKYPACVLFIDMPFEAVDVNVHPAKTEVRFYDEKRVFEAIYTAVLSAVNSDFSRPQAIFNPAKAFQQPPQKGEQLKITDPAIQNSTEIKKEPYIETRKKQTARTFIVKEFGNPVTGMENKVYSPEKDEKTLDFLNDEYYKPKVKIISSVEQQENTSENVSVKPIADLNISVDNINLTDAEGTDKKISDIESGEKCDFTNSINKSSIVPEYKFIGEAFNTYLIAEVDNKMILIDKHAAHERILFEQFKNRGVGESQMMLFPLTVTLTADEYSAVLDNIDLLNSAGYDVSDFGDMTVKLSACPPQLAQENLSEILTEIAGYLANNIKTLMPEKLDWIYHSTACRAAVKAGNFTSRFEADKFVGKLLADPTIRYCPHGRPVLIELTKYELEKQFKRLG